MCLRNWTSGMSQCVEHHVLRKTACTVLNKVKVVKACFGGMTNCSGVANT